MVYAERAETAAVSRGTSHAATKQRCTHTTSVDIKKRGIKRDSCSFRITQDKSAVSLLEGGEEHDVKAIIIILMGQHKTWTDVRGKPFRFVSLDLVSERLQSTLFQIYSFF